MNRILKEPLFQFLAVGALLFALHGSFTDSDPVAENAQIVVSDETVAWLTTTWQKQWGRAPGADELQGLIDQHVREEILYREALAMGLDRDDTIVRRRMAQKVEYLAKDLGALVEPTDDEIREYFETNVERYEVPARVSFVQVYFNPEDHPDAERAAQTALAGLRDVGNYDDQGDTFLLPREFEGDTWRDVAGQFGQSFADELFALQPGGWEGPVESGYGLHLVRISERTDAWAPPLERMRSAVELDLAEHRRREALEEYYRRVRDKYEVEVTASILPAPEAGT